MIQIRHASDRGRTRLDWLDSFHTFSFGNYHDPQHMAFGPLRVINDDIIGPGGGFGQHPHREMEIITWVLEGGVEHGDNIGNRGIIRPGDVQRMSAGSGIEHSEFNASKSQSVHLLQIWIHPSRDFRRIEPSYEQKHFDDEAYRNRLFAIAAPQGHDGALTLHQDAGVYVSRLDAGASVEHAIEPHRGAWVHVARGSITLNGQTLTAGDGAAVTEESSLHLVALDDAEALVFDLPL